MITALIVGMSLVPPYSHTSVFEAHDRQPTSYGVVTRAAVCHDPDDTGMNDGDRDCDDHGVPVDGGWAPTAVLGLAALYVFTRRRRGF
jgi:hypothetical protein